MLLLFWWSFSKYVGQRNTFLIILLKFPNAITIICIHRSLFLIIFHWTMTQGWIHADSAKVHKVYCTCEKYLQVAQIFPPQSCSIHLFCMLPKLSCNRGTSNNHYFISFHCHRMPIFLVVLYFFTISKYFRQNIFDRQAKYLKQQPWHFFYTWPTESHGTSSLRILNSSGNFTVFTSVTGLTVINCQISHFPCNIE